MGTIANQPGGSPELGESLPHLTVEEQINFLEIEIVTHNRALINHHDKRDRADGWDGEANKEFEAANERMNFLLDQWVELREAA